MVIDKAEIGRKIDSLYWTISLLTHTLSLNDNTKNQQYYDEQLSLLDLKVDLPELVVFNAYLNKVCRADSFEYLDGVTKILNAFLSLAESKNEEGVISDALKYFNYASFFSGVAFQITNNIDIQESKKYRTEISAMGGNAKSAKSKPIKKYLAELLVSKRPEDGWDSAIKAASALKADIQVLNKEYNSPLTESNLERMIGQWISNDKKLKVIFEGNLSAKGRKRRKIQVKNDL